MRIPSLPIQQLLEPVAATEPCGDDLEYDPDFLELERSSQPIPRDRLVGPSSESDGRDWNAITAHALRLLGRTKDVRLLITLIKARLRTDGLSGLAAGLLVLRQVLERYWTDVHPQLQVDGSDNTLMRINALRELCDRESVLLPLRASTLAGVPTLGNVTLRDILVASGEVQPASPAANPPLDMAGVDAIFANCDIQLLRAIADSVRTAAEHATAIVDHVNTHVGGPHVLSLEALLDLFGRLERELALRAGQRLALVDHHATAMPHAHFSGLANTDASAPEALGLRPVSAGEIGSRDQVLRVLDEVCRYYESHEPASPVPMLIRRAQRLVPMSFIDIVRELAPGGMSEIEVLRGRQEADSAY